MTSFILFLVTIFSFRGGGTNVFAVILASAFQDPTPPEFVPDPDIQWTIQEAVHPPNANRAIRLERLNSLVNLAKTEPDRVLPQLAYFWSRGDDVDEAAIFSAVRLLADIDRYTAAEALIPHLDSDDPIFQRTIEDALANTEYPSYGTNSPDAGDYEPNCRHYGRLIGNRASAGEGLPVPLIQYMIRKDPGEAVLELRFRPKAGSHAANRAVLWAEHVVSDTLWKQEHEFLKKDELEPEVVPALEAIVDDPRWWVRLYVAEMLRREPELRVPSLLEPLREDENESVRSVLSSFDQTESDGD